MHVHKGVGNMLFFNAKSCSVLSVLTAGVSVQLATANVLLVWFQDYAVPQIYADKASH